MGIGEGLGRKRREPEEEEEEEDQDEEVSAESEDEGVLKTESGKIDEDKNNETLHVESESNVK